MYNKSSKKLLSTRDAAKLLGYTHDYVGKMCREGLLEAQQIGRSWLIEEDAVEAFKVEQEERLKEYRLSAAERVANAPRETAPAKTVPTAPRVVTPSVRSPYFSKASSLAVPLVAMLLIGSVALVSSGTVARTLADSRDALRASVFDAFSQAAQSPALFASTNGILNSIFHAVSNVAVSFFTVQVAHAPTVERKNAPVVAAVQAPSLPGATTVNQYFSYVTQNPIQYIYGGVTMEYVRAAIDNVRNDLGDRGSSGGSSGGLADLSGSSIQDLSDVGSMTTAFGELLYWDGTEWTNIATSSLGISGSGTVTSVNASGGTTGLSFTGGAITTTGTLTLSGTLAITNGGTGTTTAPTYGQLLVGDGLGGYTLLATSSLGISGGTGTPGGLNGQVQYNNGGVLGGDAGFAYDAAGDRATITYASTTGISSLYASSTNASFGTLSIGSLGGLLKATAGVVSAATAGVDYESPLTFAFPLVRTVNALSLAFGTTTANTWSAQNTFSGLFATNASSTNATTSSLYITGLTSGGLAVDANGQVYKGATTTAGTGLSYSGNAFSVQTTQNIAKLSNLATNGFVKTSGGDGTLIIDTNTYLTAAVTSIGPAGQLQTGPAVTIASSTTGSDFTVTASGNTITFNLPTASSVNRGALSAGDWSTFNNKVSSTSLSAAYPLSYNSSTGAFTFGGLSTSSAAVVGNIPYFSGPNTFANVATSTVSNGTGISISGSAAVVGAGGLTITNTGVTANVAGTGISVSGATGSVTITNTGVTALSGTANQIAVSGATGSITLSLPSLVIFPNAYRGTYGTTTYASSTALSSTYASSTSAFFGSLSVGTLSGILKATGGVVSAATAGVDYLTSALTSIGPAGSLQSGPAITFATSSTAFNGLTASTTITASGNTITFANSMAGLLGVLGGGTGSSTPLGGILTGNGTGAITSAAVSAPLTFSGNTLAITQSTTGSNGYLSSTDFNTFNNKISSTSLSGGTGISYVSATGVITNTGVTSNVAGTGISVSGATGAVTITNTGVTSLAGTANQITASAATGAVTLSLPNSVIFPGTASSTAFSSLDYVAVGRTSTTTIRGEATATSTFASAIDTTRGLNLNSGYIYGAGLSSCSGSSDKLLWNATTGQFSCGADAGAGGGITAIGPAGQYQTGSTQTLASSTSAFNGLTPLLTITGSGDTLTYTSSLSGTLNNAGLTNSTVSYGGVTLSLGGTDATPAFNLVDATGLPISTGVAGLGSGVATALATNVGSAGAFVTFNGALGTPSSGTLTNATGLPIVAGTTGTLSVARGGTGTTTAPSGEIIYGGGAGVYQSVGTSTPALSSAFSYSGTLGNFVGGASGTLSLATNGVALTNLAQIVANTILANPTGATGNVQAVATSTLYGTGTGGQVLTWANGVPQWTATTTYSAPLVFAAGNVTITQSGTGSNGYLSSTDFNTFNNKISSTSLSGGTGIGYVSATGVITNTGVTSNVAGTGISVSGATGAVTITNTGVTSLAGTANQITASGATGAVTLSLPNLVVFPNAFTATYGTTTYASSTAFSTLYASSTSGFFGNISIATLNGPLQANNGFVSATTSIGAIYGGTGQTSYAVGDLLYADSGTTLTRLPVSTNGLVLKLVGGVPSWQPDLTSGGGGGAGAWSTTTDDLAIYPTDTSDVVIIGASATTTTNSVLEIFGRSYFSNTLGIATTSASSLFRLAVQGNGLFSGNLSAANIIATGTLSVSGQTTLGYASSTGFSTSYASSTSAFFGSLNVGNLSGLLKATAGSVTTAVAGTDYIVGGAGAATTTLTISGPFTTSATPVVFGSSPITSTYYGLATTSALSASGVLYSSNGAAGVASVGTSTPSLSSAFSYSGTLGNFVGGASGTLSLATNGVALTNLAQIAANTILANPTGATGNVQAVATSTLYGTGTGGQVLTWANGVPQWTATTTYSAPLVFAAGNVTITQSTTGSNGYLSSTDFNTFNNKISSTSLSGGTGISYVSATGVITNTGVTSNVAGTGISVSGATGAVTITNTGVTSLAGTANQITASAATGAVTLSLPNLVVFPNAFTATYGTTTYASSTAFSSAYASSTNVSAGNLTIGTLTGLLKATGGSVTTAVAGTDYLTSAVTSVGPAGQLQTGPAITLATSTSGTDFTITAAGNAVTFNLPSASASARGLLSTTDWSTFNNKISSTSLSGASVISYNSGTGVITTTPGTFAGSGTYTFPADLITTGNASTSNLFATDFRANTAAIGGTGTTTFTSAGFVGVGSSTPWARLSINPIATDGSAPAFAIGSSTGTTFKVTNGGVVEIGNTSVFTNFIGLATPAINIGTGASVATPGALGGSILNLYNSNAVSAQIGSGGYKSDSTGAYAWTATNAGSTVDTSLTRISAGVVGVNTNAVNVSTPGNYYGTFVAGKIGLGTTTPYALLSVTATSTSGIGAPTTLFAIASTTAGTATSTLFSVSNTGTVTTALGTGLVKSTAGVLGLGVAGTDYIAGGVGAATTTVTCAGTASCTGFTVFGAAPITITGSGLSSYDAWTHPAAGQSATTSLMLFNGAASSTQLSANVAYFGGTGTSTFTSNGFLGIGTSSPWAQLSVNPTSANGTAPAFAIGSSSATSLVVTNAGNVGIGTLTPSSILHIRSAAPTVFIESTNASEAAQLAFQTPSRLITFGSNDSTAGYGFYDNTAGAWRQFITYPTGNVGFGGVTNPLSKVSISGSVAIGSYSDTVAAPANGLIVSGTTGVGTSSPYANLSVHQSATQTGTTLFAIGSSTASATTTLFSVSNTGTVTTVLGTGLVESTNGVLSLAVAGTDYIAGGAGAATSTVTCAGTASCTGFVAFAAAPITITGIGLTAYDAWTHPTAGQSATTSLMLFNGNASSTQFSAGLAYFGQTGTTTITGAGFVGVGSSTPWAQLSVNPTSTNGTAPAFVIGSSTATAFVVDNTGHVAIGATAPEAGIALDINGGGILLDNNTYLQFEGSGGSNNNVLAMNGANNVLLNTVAGTSILFQDGGTTNVAIDGLGRIGIGTTTQQWALTVASSTGPQVTLTDGSATAAPFNFRAINNALYFSTSSPTTFATTSSSFVTFDALTGSTTLQKFDVSGTATSSFGGGHNLISGCYAVNGVCLTTGVSSVANVDGTLTISPTTGGVVASLNLGNANTWTGKQTFTYASSTGFSTSYASSTSAFLGSLNVGTLTGLLKGTAGAVGTAVAGTDYIAGGAGAATTTLTISGPFTTSATPVVFGSSPITSTYYGLATTSALSSSQLLVSNGAAGVYGVSTSTATLGLGLSGSITGLGGSNSLSVATSSLYTGSTGQAAYFNGTNQMIGTSTLFIATNQNVGIGTTSPYAKLSVTNTGTAPSFVVEDSASPDTTPFIIDASGNVGIGSSSPRGTLTVSAGGAPNFLDIEMTGGGYGLKVERSTSDRPNIQSYVLASGAAGNLILNEEGGFIGIGTSTPTSQLSLDGQTSAIITLAGGRVGNSGNFGSIDFTNTDTVRYTGARIDSNNDGQADDGTLRFYTNSDGSTSAEGNLGLRMLINSDGNIGIGGEATPASLFTVGNGDLFQVNSAGAIVAATGITSSGNTSLAAATSTTLFASRLTANTAAFGGTGSTTISSTGALVTPSLTVGSLSGLLKGTAGVVSAATAGTDYVAGGTGAANQLAYFTGSGAIAGNAAFTIDTASGRLTTTYASSTAVSSLSASFGATATTTFTSGGSVGIGSSSPTKKLVVEFDSSGAGGTAVANGLMINDTSTGSTWDMVNAGAAIDFASNDLSGVGAGGRVRIGTVAETLFGVSHRLGFFTAPTTAGTYVERFSILSGGNVGIGTISPTALLNVKSAASTDALTRITTGSGEQDARLFLGETDTHGITLEYEGITNIGYIGMNDGVDPTGSWSKRIQMSRTGTEVAFMAGNVGIGTTTPLGRLHVTTGNSGAGAVSTNADEFVIEGTSAAGMTILSANNNLGYINFGDPDDTDMGSITYSHVSNALGFAANNLGITATFDGNSFYNFNVSDPEFRLSDNTINAKLKIEDASGLAFVGATSNHPFQIRTNNIGALTIDTAQDVGIGSTSPYAKLSITNTGSNPSFLVEDGASPDTSPFVIDASGNVAIGTTTTSTRLEIASNAAAGTGNTNFLRLTEQDTTIVADQSWGIDFYSLDASVPDISSGYMRSVAVNAGTQFALAFGTANGATATESLRIDFDGKVGIGTTTPDAKLDVYVTSGVGLSIDAGVSGADIAQFSRRNGATTDLKITGANGDTSVIFGSGGTDRYIMGYDSSAANFAISSGALLGTNDRLVIDAVGDVGIGTSTPYALLSVNAPAGRDAFAVGSSTGTYFRVTSLGTTTVKNFDIIGATATSSSNVGFNLTSGCFAVNGTCVGASGGTINSGTTGQIPYYAAGGTTLTATSTIFINTASNVGIGTAAPTDHGAGYKTLAINGTATGRIDLLSSGIELGTLYNSGSTFRVGNVTAGSVALITNDTEQVVVDASGNTTFAGGLTTTGFVGVGSSTPWARLSINPIAADGSAPAFAIGSSTATEFVVTNAGNVGIATASPMSLLSTTQGTSGYGMTLSSTLNNGWVGIQLLSGDLSEVQTIFQSLELSGAGLIGTQSNHPFLFRTNNTEQMRITAGGLVGVGTTSPWANFAVNPIAGIAANQFVVGSSTGTSFLIENSGHVGIGTSSPTYLLDVLAGTQTQNGNYIASFTRTGAAGGLRIGANNAAAILGGISTAGGGSQALAFNVSNGGVDTEAGRFSSAGFFGVGTTSPYAKLSVVGPVVAEYFHGTSSSASTFGGNINVGGTGQQYVGFSTGGNALALNASFGTGLTSTASIFMNIDGNNDEATRFFAVGNNNVTLGSATELFRVQESGTVGVGTSSPYALLSVNAPAGQDAFAVGSSTGTYFRVTSLGTTTVKNFDIIGATATSSSNVGFNITGGCFAVNGTCVGGGGGAVSSVSNADGTLTISPTTGAVVASLNLGNVNSWTARQNFANASSSLLSANYAQFGGTATTTFTAAGFVGVGTSTPWAQLSINPTTTNGTAPSFVIGSSSATRFIVDNAGQVGVNTTAPSALLNVGGTYTTANATGRIGFINTTMNTTATVGYGLDVAPTFASTSSATPFLIGFRSAPTVTTANVPSITNFYTINSAPTIGSTYAGTISNLYGYIASSPTNNTSNPITSYVSFGTGPATTNGDGITSGTVTNRGFYHFSGTTASSSAGGTVNNFGAQIALPSGSPNGGTTNNYGVYISGNGGTSNGGTVNNFSFRNESTANSYFAGNVGIGTTSPVSLLALGVDTLAAGTRQAITIGNAGFAAPAGVGANSNGDKFVTFNNGTSLKTALGVASDELWFQSSGSASAHLSFYTASDTSAPSERMRITSAGNVGIGTTTPNAPLVVNGQTSAPSQALLVTTDTFGSTGSYIRIGHGASSGDTYGEIDNLISGGGAYGNLVLQAGGGNVGIGTTTPAQQLTVANSAGGTLGSIDATGGTNSAVLQFKNNSQIWNEGLGSAANANIWRVFDVTNGVTSLAILPSSGNVGIGTTSPWGKLSVTNTGAGPSFIVEDSASPDTTPFIIDASGNVGVGTTSPASKFSVSGSGYFSSNVGIGTTPGSVGMLTVQSVGDVQLALRNTSGVDKGYIGTTGSLSGGSTDDLRIRSDASNIQFGFNGAETARLTSGGFFGVGTSTPGSPISLSTSGAEGIHITINGGSQQTYLRGYAGTSLITSLYRPASSNDTAISSWGDLIFLPGQNETGYAGISTTSPYRTLSVTGDIAFTSGNFYVNTNLQVLTPTGGAQTVKAGALLIAANYAGTPPTNGLYVEGKTGLGTTTPWRKLSVTDTSTQFVVGYDTTRYTQFQTDSVGNLTIDPQNGGVFMLDENLWLCAGGACPAGGPSGNGYAIVENGIGVGSSTPWAGLSVVSGKAIVVAENTLATSTSMTVDWKNGNQQLVRLGTAGTTISFTGFIEGQKLVLTVCNPNATAGTITWGTQILWPAATVPTQTTTSGKCDVWSFLATQATSTIKIFGSQNANF